MSLANVFGPLLAGSLYGFHSGYPVPVGFWTYAACALAFAVALPIAFFGISARHPIFAPKHQDAESPVNP